MATENYRTTSVLIQVQNWHLPRINLEHFHYMNLLHKVDVLLK